MKGWEMLASNIEMYMSKRIINQLQDNDTYTEKLPDRYILYKKGKYTYPQPPEEGRTGQMCVFMYRRWRRKNTNTKRRR